MNKRGSWYIVGIVALVAVVGILSMYYSVPDNDLTGAALYMPETVKQAVQRAREGSSAALGENVREQLGRGAISTTEQLRVVRQDPTCVDSDNGRDIYRKGSITYTDAARRHLNRNPVTDSCFGNTILGASDRVIEYTCKRDEPTGIVDRSAETIACPVGTVCLNGACKPGSVCRDTDFNNPNVKGKTESIGETGGYRIKFDKCKDSSTLIEYYCDRDTMAKREHSCSPPGICNVGACGYSRIRRCMDNVLRSYSGSVNQACDSLFGAYPDCVRACGEALTSERFKGSGGYGVMYYGRVKCGLLTCEDPDSHPIYGTGIEFWQFCRSGGRNGYTGFACTHFASGFKRALAQLNSGCATMVDTQGCVSDTISSQDRHQERGQEPPLR